MVTLLEKRSAVSEYCGRTSCSLCKIVCEWENGIPNAIPPCLDIYKATEEELDRALVLIGEDNPVTRPSAIKDSGDRTTFSTSAQRDMHEGKGRFDLLPMCVLMRLAKHYEAGAKKYDERNWEKGIPCHSFADSAMRHLVKYMDGHKDEDHLIAAIWNLCGLAWTEEKKPELMDIPARKE